MWKSACAAAGWVGANNNKTINNAPSFHLYLTSIRLLKPPSPYLSTITHPHPHLGVDVVGRFRRDKLVVAPLETGALGHAIGVADVIVTPLVRLMID